MRHSIGRCNLPAPIMGEAGIILIGLLLCTIGMGMTVWLAFRTWKRRKVASLWTRLVVAVVVAAAAFGSIGTLLGLIKTFGAVGGQSVDPSHKARMLAEGISEAMNCTALALVFWVPSVIAALVLSRTSKDQAS